MSATDTSAVADVLASTAFRIVERAFDSLPGSERKCFKLANMTTVEALSFIEVCENAVSDGRLNDTRIIVAHDAPEAFPASYRAAASETITTYRNRISPGQGLIYIETKVESDSQGLKNLFTLRDINFLDGSFDADGFETPNEIVRNAVYSVMGAGADHQSLLVDRCVQVLKGLQVHGIPVSVRKFASFALAVARARAERDEALDSAEIDIIVGKCLIDLDLFPDESWNEDASASRVSRRLSQNLLHAELASSQNSDLDADKLAEQCSRTRFLDEDNEEYPDSEQARWRNICADYCVNPLATLRHQIPYRIFEQLFSRSVSGLPLGERVETEIDENAPERLKDFNDIDVKAGLNRKQMDDAQRFLETESDRPEELPLRDLISAQTRRMVERVAYPTPERFENPLTKIAEVVELFRRRADGIRENCTLKLRLPRNADPSNVSIGLFSFLYGATLTFICASSRDTSGGYILETDSVFTEIVPPPPLPETDGGPEAEDEVQEDEALIWNPVPVEFVLVDNEDGREIDSEYFLEWYPTAIARQAFFWLMSAADDRPEPLNRLRLPSNQSADSWIENVTARTEALNSCIAGNLEESVMADDLISRLFEIREQFCSHCLEKGISASFLDDYFDGWSALLQEARTRLIPEGRQDPLIGTFIEHECIVGSDGRSMLMLASHPLRARWIARYLRRSEELALRSLNDELPLNSQNETHYLRWIENLSPHQQPAVHVAPDGNRLLSSREEGWTEEFTPVSTGQNDELSESVSLGALSEIASQITTYLEAHPYKSDGLSILIVSPGAPRLPADLISLVRRGDWRDCRLVIHFATPRTHWEKATTFFEQVPTDNRLTGSSGLFPPIQLALHDLNEDDELDDSFNDLSFDIAVIPQFLHDEITVREQTSPRSDETGSFDPLMDQPTYIYGGDQGGAISVAQHPRNFDEALANWSTLVVRQQRMSPISKEQPENSDVWELQIDFRNAARLFAFLHERSHWVITLERYITREQIEALENRPEILTVKDGVGPGGAYTLIVSSNLGRTYIIGRLERKLTHLVERTGGIARIQETSRELAEKIYEETRQIAPWLALKAMGISRVTEEILGLMVGRKVLDFRYPVEAQRGLSVWLSFDQHQDWFGKENAIRADLCRITFDDTEEGLLVDVIVLESKLRGNQYDPHGVKQVAATMKLLEDIMPPPEDSEEEEFVDAAVWRESILDAIETVSTQAVQVIDMPELTSGTAHRIPPEIRTRFREGNFRLRTFAGIYSICLYEQADKFAITDAEGNARIKIARSFGAELLALAHGEAPTVIPPGESEEANSTDTTVSQDPPDEPVTGDQTHPVIDPPDSVAPVKTLGAGSEEETGSDKAKPVQRKLSDEELEKRYQQILNTYGEFGIQVHAPANKEDRFVEGPASVLYRVERGHGVTPEKIKQQGETLKLNLRLAEEQEVRFGSDSGFITIDVPKSSEDRFFVSSQELWDVWESPEDHLAVPLGVDRYGKPVSVDFSSSNSPHLLIGGTTGSGKSEALNTILAGLTRFYEPNHLRLLLVDPKGTELEHLSGSPHLDGDIGWDAEDTLGLLSRAVDEMERRYKLFKEARQRSLPDYNAAVDPEERIPWWLMVLDEYADLTSEREDKKAIEDRLKRLAQKARAAGIHLIIATQKPAAEVISTNLRSNLPAQLALRVKSPTESRVVMDETGAETLNGMGDAFLKSEGRLTRIQCAKT